MKAIIICNGEKPNFNIIFQPNDMIIAADGGAYLCKELRLSPHYIIGDLDSYVPKENLFPETKIIKSTCQESNDLEKAIKLALELGAEKAEIYAALGKRLDHTLTNLSLMKKYQPFVNLKIIDNYFEIILLDNSFQVFQGWPDRAIALFPISGIAKGITTSGLKYNLNNESLENGSRHGSSNQMNKKEFSILVKEGDVILMQGKS